MVEVHFEDEGFDPDLCISAGFLRKHNIEIPKTVPDFAQAKGSHLEIHFFMYDDLPGKQSYKPRVLARFPEVYWQWSVLGEEKKELIPLE